MFEKNKVHLNNCLIGMEQMKDNSVTHTFTSPPYNRKRNDKYSFYDDALADYKTFLDEVINQCLRVSDGFVFFNIQKNYYNKVDVFEIIGKYAKNMVDIIIWNKSNPMPCPGTQITNSYEFIFVLSDNKKSLRGNGTYTKNHFTTSAFTNNEYNKIHKAVMHPEAAKYIIENFTKENELIFDPFSGVGTTGIVAIENKRTFLGFELEKTYQEIANNRINEVLLNA